MLFSFLLNKFQNENLMERQKEFTLLLKDINRKYYNPRGINWEVGTHGAYIVLDLKYQIGKDTMTRVRWKAKKYILLFEGSRNARRTQIIRFSD